MNGSFPRRHCSRRTAPVRRVLGLGLCLLLALSSVAFAGTSGSTNLFTPAAGGRAASLGDFFSATAGGGGLNTIYRYFIEVPTGLTRMRVQLFDADVLLGGNAESAAGRDRNDGGATTTTVIYTLIRPNGVTAATLTCANNAVNPCTGRDNVWSNLLDSTAAADLANGHWELDVDMRTGTGDDLNGFGIRADNGDETSAGTELNVYYDTHANIGVNLDATTNTRTYRFYPYITSGCTMAENDFDYDVGGGTGNGPGSTFGQVDLTSPSTLIPSVTRQVTSANLSANNAWKRNTLARWGTDSSSSNYGLWTLDQRISNFQNGGNNSNNYTNMYFTNDQAVAGNPTANPSANSFRIYFPSDGGNKPAKPFLEQFLACIPTSACAAAPAVNVTRSYRVTVRLTNPSGDGSGPITFSATNVVTVRFPGSVAGATITYLGQMLTTQGTVLTQPALNAVAASNITWNPGTVNAGTTALMAYVISIQPTAAGRYLVTGTPALNGTRATWVDSTANTTQARATFSTGGATGGVCELAIDTTVITPAIVSGLSASRGAEGTEVAWTTASEVGTIGFDLLRFDRASRAFVKVNERLLPALITAPQGGSYRLLDRTAPAYGQVRYRLVEHLSDGGTREHGPYRVQIAERGANEKREGPTAFSRQAWTPVPVPSEGASDGVDGFARKAAGVAAIKIGVGSTGLYRVSAATIASQFGLSSGAAQTLVIQRGLRLSHLGREIPWFGTADGLVFFGRALDSLYSRDNVYRLTLGSAGAAPEANGGNPIAPVADLSFQESGHVEQDRFAATVVATDPDSDYWYWDFLVAADPSFGTRSFPLDLPGLGTGGTHLNVQLQGATKSGITGEHHATVRVNGTDLGAVQWTGIAPQTASFDLPPGLLTESGNTVEVSGLLDAGVAQSVFYVDGFDVSYSRHLRASGDALAFRSSGTSPLTVGGFSAPNVTVLEVTNPENPRRVVGTLVTGTSDASVTLNAMAGAQYFAAGPQGIQNPAWVRVDTPSQLRGGKNGADYLVVTAQSLMAPASDLAALRTSQGLTSKVVDIEDIYDEFNNGIPSPKALADFLAWARTKWSPAPRYVALVGGGNYDYRDLLGQGGNLVPPLMAATLDGGLFASDYSLTQSKEKKEGAKGPFSIGRIPVTSAAALQAYVDKLRSYENGAPAPWGIKALLLADSEGAHDFSPDAEELAGYLAPDFSPERIFLSQQTLADARERFLSEMSSGVAIVNYLGHGALDRLSAQGLLTSSDIPALTNGSRAPLLTAFTCIINRFDVPGFVPLGALLTNASNGGAIAVFAPTGLNENAEGKALGQLFYQQLGNGDGSGRLGDVVQRAVSSYLKSGGGADQVKVYTLLGDPAVRLTKGALPPPFPTDPPGGPNG